MSSNKQIAIFSLIKEGKLAQAEKKCKKALKQGGSAADHLHLLALIELEKNNPKKAERYARDSLAQFAMNETALNTLSIAQKQQKKYDEALVNVNRALEISPGHIEVTMTKVDLLVELEDITRATEVCTRLFEANPGNNRIAFKLAKVLEVLGERDRAIDVLQVMLDVETKDVDIILLVSMLLDRSSRLQEAVSLVTEFVDKLEPDARLLAELARLHERSNNLEEAERNARSVLAIDPKTLGVRLTLAKVLRRQGEYEEALALTQMAAENEKNVDLLADLEYETATICDAMRNHDAAFTSWSRANAHIKSRHQASDTAIWQRISAGNLQIVDQSTLQQFSRSDYSPIFMVGFPRSGTTLLHTLLDQHSRISVVDEKPVVTNHLVSQVEKIYPALEYPLSVQHLDSESVRVLSDLYLHELGVGVQADMVVDKLPLNFIHLPLLLRLFKKPRFIFSVRHPCDACLSAFNQNFGINRAMFEFLEFDSTIQFYELVMNMWLHYLKTFNFNYCAVRYEDLVADRETELRKLTAFLGIDLEDSMLDEERRIESKKLLTTPSYHQVNKPIYKGSVYRWRNYEKYFKPYMHILDPFIKQFGYEE